MKTKILLTHLFLLLFLTSFSQAYIPFIKEGKMWTEAYGSSIDSIHYTGIVSHKMEGDTIINSKIYKKVFSNFSNLDCFVYEDTVLKKVYCLYPSENEFLLYDFNPQIGDTIEGDDCMVVENKTTEFLAGKNRTKITFEWGFASWYEGIGSPRQGVFQMKCLVGGVTKLICYYENDTLLFHNPSPANNCFNFTDNLEIQNNPIISNFSNNILNIQTFNSSIYFVQIYDLFGKIIEVKDFHQELTLDLSALAKGMYIYSIRSNDPNYFINKKILTE